MPSLALRIATLVPRICAFIRSAIARPAASSLEELTRRPEDSRSIEVDSDVCEVFRCRCEFSDVMLVLMVWGMAHSGEKVGAILFPRPSAPIAGSEALLAANSRPGTKKAAPKGGSEGTASTPERLAAISAGA